jgi:hypothetical protein
MSHSTRPTTAGRYPSGNPTGGSASGPRRAPPGWVSGIVYGAAGLLSLTLVWRAFSRVIFPDELHALDFLRAWNDQGGGLLPPNQFGYGSSWWLLLNALSRLFAPTLYLHDSEVGGVFPMITPTMSATYTTIYAGRLCGLAALLAAVAYAITAARDSLTRRLLCGMLLLPLVWWDGKWLGPDFFAIACAVTAASLVENKSRAGAMFFLGAAIGLRLSNLAVLSGFVVLAVGCRRTSAAAGLVATGALLLGYLAANPYLVLDPSVAWQNAQGIAPEGEVTWARALSTVSNCVAGNRREWDLASTGSIVYWWGGPLLPSVLAIALFKANRLGVVAAIVLSFGLGVVAVGYRGLGYGWYFMPTVAAAYVLAIGAISLGSWRPAPRRAFVGALCAALAWGAVSSLAELRANQARQHMLLACVDNSACVHSALAELKDFDILYLLVDPATIVIDAPGKRLRTLGDSLPQLADPDAFDLTRAVVIASGELERQSAAVGHFMRSLRRRGARTKQCGPLEIAY